MRFVPDIADARFPATPNTRMKAVKMMSKQRAFLDNTKVIRTSTIAGVHSVVKKIAIKSKDDPNMGLFISIDEQDADGSCTAVFTVHNDRYEEASGLIPLFCVIYAAKFGDAAWEWFTAEEAKVVLSKCKWSADEGQVAPIVPEDDEEGIDLTLSTWWKPTLPLKRPAL
jgi:hypothetical protein